VGVGENEVNVQESLFYKVIAESPDPCAGVDNDNVPTSGPNLHTSGVAAIFDIFST
jgi:hypothetical protein